MAIAVREVGTAVEQAPARPWGRLVRRYAPIVVGIAMAACMILIAAGAPYIAPMSPSAQFSDAVLKGPGAVERHALGTDEFGRDILSRIIWGTRISLEVGRAGAANDGHRWLPVPSYR